MNKINLFKKEFHVFSNPYFVVSNIDKNVPKIYTLFFEKFVFNNKTNNQLYI